MVPLGTDNGYLWAEGQRGALPACISDTHHRQIGRLELSSGPERSEGQEGPMGKGLWNGVEGAQQVLFRGSKQRVSPEWRCKNTGP